MSLFSTIKKLLTKTFLSELEGSVKSTMKVAEERAEELINHAEERAKVFMHNLVKGLVVFVMIVMGAIFALVGLSNLIEIHYSMTQGAGLIIVGGVLVLLAIFANAMQREK